MKKRKPGNSRKKLPPMRGGQIVPVNSLDTAIYVNMYISGTTVTIVNITNPLVKSVATSTPGSIILSVDPSLSTLKDYTIFGYNGTSWGEIPRLNIDMGGNTVALYGNVPGVALRKQKQDSAQVASLEVSIPVPVSTYGKIMQFVNMSDSMFGSTINNFNIINTDSLISTVVNPSSPTALAVDSLGNVYIAATGSNIIAKFTTSTGIYTAIAGIWAGAYSSPDGVATSVQIWDPDGIAIDSAGLVYFAEFSGNKVRRINADGTTTTIAGTGTGGYTGNGSAANTAQINNPIGITFDSAGNLYFTEWGSHVIRKVTAINRAITASSIISTVAGTGTAGSTGDGGLATAAQLNKPQGVAVDSAGNIYIADTGNNRIRKVTASTGIITTIAGTGTAGYTGDTSTATSAQLQNPQSVTLDPIGNIYITDASNNVIRRITNGIITTIAGTGTAGSTGDGGLATSAKFNNPHGGIIDSVGNLYIADRGNSAIRKVIVNTVVNAYIKLSFASNYTTVNTKQSGWLPTIVPGLALWLDTAEPGDNTSNQNQNLPLTKWIDKSGNNNHAFGGSTPPIYLGPSKGIYFDGRNTTYLSGNIGSVSQYMYSFIVARANYKGPAEARLLSLSQPNADDNSSNAYMGVSASSNTAATPSTKTLVIGLDAEASPTTSRLIYNNTLITKTPTISAASIAAGWYQCIYTAGTPAWINGACTSIAYNGFMFVAVGDDGTNGLIYYSYDGIVWTAATQNVTAPRTSIFYRAATASTTVPTATSTLNGNGGISVVIYTGSLWLCGGRSSSNTSANGDTPGLAYSYDGINWYEITNLPFTGRGDCVRSISTNGNLILLAGHLLPCLNYSYDGINWYNSPASAISAVKLDGTLPFTGAKCVTWSKILNMWMVGGDGGTPDPTNNSVDPSIRKKFLTSLDGFTWSPMDYGSTTTNFWIHGANFPSTAIATTELKYMVHRIVENNFYSTDTAADFTASGSISGTILDVYAFSGTNLRVGIKIGAIINNGSYYGVVLSYGTASPTSPLGTYNLDPFYGTIPTAVTLASINIYNKQHVLLIPPIGYGNAGRTNADYGGYMLYPSAGYATTYNTYAPFSTSPWTAGTAEIRSSYSFVNSSAATVLTTGMCTLYGVAGAGASYKLCYTLGNAKTAVAITVSLITAAVNAIVDNTNPNINIAANTHINSIKTTATTPDTNNIKPYLITAATNGMNTYVRINGSQTVSTKATVSNFNISTYMVGKNNGSSFNNYAGYIYEILTFNQYLSPLARSVIEGYLAWKWALNGLLPSNHPFSLKAPTVKSTIKEIPIYLKDLQPVLWLDAQDPYGNSPPPADRTLISKWFDKSGNGNHAVSPSGSEPMFRTHVVKAGGIHFNRYPYMSMGLVPICTPTTTFTTGSVLTNTVSTTGPWTGGFGGFAVDSNSNIVACADNAGFVYMGITRKWATRTLQIAQFDETNIQTRLLYSILYANTTLTDINCITVGLVTGNIYATFYNSTANINQQILILTPSALPITSDTTYTARTVTLQDPAGLSFNGTNSTGISDICGLVTDENENLYAVSMATFNKWYRFPISSLTATATTWISDMTYTVTSALTVPGSTIMKNISAVYSSKDKSISFALPPTTTSSTIPTRAVMYLTISGTNTFQHIGIAPGQTVTTAVRSSDGLFDASLTTADTTGNAITTYTNDNSVYSWTYDPIGEYLFTPADDSTMCRIKRIDVKTRQMTTIAGAVNAPYGTTTVTSAPVFTERFPVVTEASGSYDSPLKTDTTAVSHTNYYKISNPLIVGSKGAYIGIFQGGATGNGDYNIYNRAMKLTNLRATPSCMTGPINISARSVSVFIVYLNMNANKSLLPHPDSWKTPLLSLSSRTDYVTFVGSITGTVLTVNTITAGTIQLGATLNTPLGGFISSLASGTISTAGSTYNISISQTAAAYTKMSASNGIDRTNTTMAGTNGASLGLDALSKSHISLYMSRTNGAGWSSATVIRNNVTYTTVSGAYGAVAGAPGAGVSALPSNGLDTSFPMIPEMLFYSSNSNWISSKLNGGTLNSFPGAFDSPFDISSFGLGIQPPNAARKDALLPNYFFDGTVCEVLVYNADLTTSANTMRVTAIEGALAWKWGLQSRLPATHMYKNFPPNDVVESAPTTITINTTPVNLTDTSVTISWSGGDGAIAYSYSVIADGVATGTIIDNGLASKSITVNDLKGGKLHGIYVTAYSTFNSTAQASSTFTTYVRKLSWLAGNIPGALVVDGAPATATFSNIHTLAVDSNDNIYLIDMYQSYCKVRIATPAGFVASTNISVLNVGNTSCGSAVYCAMAIDRNTNIVYINTGSGSILKAVPSSPNVSWGSDGKTLSTTWTVTTFVSATVTPATVNLAVQSYAAGYTYDLAVDSLGNLYFITISGTVGASYINKIDVKNNNATSQILLDSASNVSNSGLFIKTAAGWSYPTSLAIDQFNNIYAMNGGKDYIILISADRLTRTRICTGGTEVYDGTYDTAAAAFEYNRSCLAASRDGSGIIYVNDGNNNTRFIKPDTQTFGTLLSSSGAAQNTGPYRYTPLLLAADSATNARNIGTVTGTSLTTPFMDLKSMAIDSKGNIYMGGRSLSKVGLS